MTLLENISEISMNYYLVKIFDWNWVISPKFCRYRTFLRNDEHITHNVTQYILRNFQFDFHRPAQIHNRFGIQNDFKNLIIMFIIFIEQDTHLLNLEDYKYGGSNITAVRLLDKSRRSVAHMMNELSKDW